MVQQMDADGNGVIDYHEFINVALLNNEFLKKENLVKAFNCLDLNSNGKISIEELKFSLPNI